MPYFYMLFRRIARLRVPAFAALLVGLVACDRTDVFDPDGSIVTDALDEGIAIGDEAGDQLGEPAFAIRYAGGIPIGMNAQPIDEFGEYYNGAKLTIGPARLMKELPEIKARGAKIALMMAGNHRYYLDANGRFSLTKWKARIDRYKNIKFDAYITDGTIVGHYMVDEPGDPRNWGGKPIPPSTLDEMGRYSKQLWPKMPTIVRQAPDYWKSPPRYVDAAWAQYLSRRGPVKDYARKVVADAQRNGMGLVVGLNVLKGGTPNGTKMTASQVEQFGSALLSSSYPCAFFSWQYNSSYLSSSSIKAAMKKLRTQAQNRSTKACRG